MDWICKTWTGFVKHGLVELSIWHFFDCLIVDLITIIIIIYLSVCCTFKFTFSRNRSFFYSFFRKIKCKFPRTWRDVLRVHFQANHGAKELSLIATKLK